MFVRTIKGITFTYHTTRMTHHFHLCNLHVCCTFELMKGISENCCHMQMHPHNMTSFLKNQRLLSRNIFGSHGQSSSNFAILAAGVTEVINRKNI